MGLGAFLAAGVGAAIGGISRIGGKSSGKKDELVEDTSLSEDEAAAYYRRSFEEPTPAEIAEFTTAIMQLHEEHPEFFDDEL